MGSGPVQQANPFADGPVNMADFGGSQAMGGALGEFMGHLG